MQIVCLGELLLRLKAPGYERILQSNQFEATFCGAEANVAVNLAHWGEDTSFVTVLPDHALGDRAMEELRRWGVNTEKIVRAAGRLGTFYLEAGANQRPSQVIYDRAFSAIAMADPALICWTEVLAGADWLHVSGITPAISASAARMALEAVQQARAMGITVSCDLNYRSALWRYGVSAPEMMRKFAMDTDVLIANEEDIQKALGLGAEARVTGGKLERDHYRALCRKVVSSYPNIKVVAITLRESYSADHNDWSACLYADGTFFESTCYPIFHIVDRVGAGDCFASGLIYGLIHSMPYDQALEFAVAASCLKHSISGDFARVTVPEIRKLMDGNASGRVVR